METVKTKFQGVRDKLFLVKFGDLWGFVLILAALIPALILRRQSRKIWMLCERREEARDNGFAFFRYLRENHPEIDAYYAIDFNSRDYQRVKKYGDHVVPFGSFRHCLYYLACDANVSSVKNCGPNNLVGYVFRKLNLMNNKVCFLQHGTIKDRLDWLMYPETKMRVFCCSAVPEYEYVKRTYGYPEGSVIYNGGQARFDDLYLPTPDLVGGPYLLVMPTWRQWLKPGDPNLQTIEGTTDFTKTEYYRCWTEFLRAPALQKMLSDRDLKLVFYPHPTMQEYIQDFSAENEGIVVANEEDWDLQELIRGAEALITDYSSVYFDFVYQGKPVYSYQFDLSKFRRFHYASGYLTYTDNPFLIPAISVQQLVKEVQRGAENGFKLSSRYVKARDHFFPTRDQHNRRRIFQNLSEIIYNEKPQRDLADGNNE